MDAELFQLVPQLLATADASLLDVPLDHLCARIVDEEARELLSSAHDSGQADSLRDLLAVDTLQRWLDGSCTAREELALLRLIRGFLGSGASGDDPTRLVSIEPVPGSADELLAWAARTGVERTLMRPADELLQDPTLPRDATLFEVCLGLSPSGRRGSLLAYERSKVAARALIQREAARVSAREARKQLHQAALPSGALGLLARRLRALLTGTELDALEPLRFVPARPVSVELETGVARGALCSTGDAAPVRVALYLSGFEQRALEGSCSECLEPSCLHRMALAARLFEACLARSDPLHRRLESFVGIPSWQRFVQALAPPVERGSERGRICFALRLEGERVSVGVLHQRVQGDGRLSPGRLVSPQKVARSARLDDRESAVLAALSANTRTLTAQFLPADLVTLRALVEHPAVQLEGESEPLRVVEESVHVQLLEQPEGLTPRVTLAELPVRPPAGTSASGTVRTSYLLQHDRTRATLTFAPLLPPIERLLSALAHFRGVLPKESFPTLAPWLASLQSVARVSTPKVLEGLARPAPSRLLLRLSPRFDEGLDLSLSVRALPLAPLWPPAQGPELVHGIEDGMPCSVRRDLALERALSTRIIEELELDSLLELAPFSYRVESTQAALALLSRAARMSELLELEWAERKERLRIHSIVRASDLKIAFFKHGDFCTLQGGVQDGALRIAVDRLLEAARTGERFVAIDGADYVEIEQTLFARLADAQLVLMPSARELSMSSAALPLWLSKLGEQTSAGDAESAAWLARTRDLNDSAGALEVDGLIDGQLRDYQRAGVQWLHQRSTWAPGVCLADEMGLGKTVQAIALMVARRERGPALVVAPTSVVDGWCSELARFAPRLRALRYRGAKRADLLLRLDADCVLVTSYELLLRDRARFDSLRFGTLIVDEAQLVKNARTLRARAVASLQTEFRVALSGTPVENRLGDLWSLFHLIAPGLLGGWSRFRARFAVPIERYEDDERARVLGELIAPFILRREKREVAPELPARTEVVHPIELSTAERDLYAAALAHARRALGKRRRHPNEQTRTVQILAELTRLRQLACHPRLVIDDSRVTSSKLSALLRLLEELLPRGHRVLVFSQFVRHLALVREAVAKLGISYLQLDGSTAGSERAALVARFQRGEAPLFLMSLKAGGTGLNLTAADYVIHMDPWWNPSAEDQASDRAHRIGQERPVTVVKLVSQGTIEERVVGLHAHKRQLAELVLRSAEHTPNLAPDLRALERLLLA